MDTQPGACSHWVFWTLLVWRWVWQMCCGYTRLPGGCREQIQFILGVLSCRLFLRNNMWNIVSFTVQVFFYISVFPAVSTGITKLRPSTLTHLPTNPTIHQPYIQYSLSIFLSTSSCPSLWCMFNSRALFPNCVVSSSLDPFQYTQFL